MCVWTSLQSCPTLCDPMDYSSPGSSVHGILQAKILEWVACPPPGDLPNPGTKPAPLMSPLLAGGFFFFFFLPLEHVGSPELAHDPAVPFVGSYPRK